MKRILGAIICCFVVATGYIAYVITERQTALQKFSRYNDSWSIAQSVSEYFRLEHRLSALALGQPDVDRDEIRMRLEFMLGRLELLQQGNLRDFIQDDPQRHQLYMKLSAIIHQLDEQLDTISPEGMKAILHSMNTLDAPLTALSAAAMEHDINIIDVAQRQVKRLHLIYTALAASLIICGIILIILLIRHNTLLDKAHRHMQRLTADLRKATAELKLQNFRLEHDAHHDALTGLPNRVLFRKELDKQLAAELTGGPVIAILLLDLDGFKDVNDTLGHDVGDGLLQAVAGRLKRLSPKDAIVCRLGGDEFAVLCTGMAEQSALAFSRLLLNEINRPYKVGEMEMKVGTCIGVAISNGTPDAEELFKHADLALYKAKAVGPGQISSFQPQMLTHLQEKKSFEADLQAALQNGEIDVYYQPQAETVSREICGYEALLRWTHPVRGSVPPTQFIPVAEKIGTIFSLGAWVLNAACVEAASWNKSLKIAVNLSPVQFRDKTLVQTVIRALETSGLDPSRLELEITESVLLDKNDQTLDSLRRLKALGLQIAMDDFGTGYSSLGSLSGFPFDKIKIDRSFVHDVTTRSDALAIVELVTGVGRSLHMTTIAEGIETEEQYACLKRLGCDQIQGFLIGKPLPVTELAYLHEK